MNRLNNKDQIFKVAIYLRLSKDDGDLSFLKTEKQRVIVSIISESCCITF